MRDTVNRKVYGAIFRLDSCADQYSYYQTVICNLMEICFPTKIVRRHTADKPWVTDWFRDLVRKGQRAHMSGDLNQAKILRNEVNRAASKLKYNFYQTQIAAIMNRDPTIGGSI